MSAESPVLFLADECLDKTFVIYLRTLGYNIVTAQELGLSGVVNGALMQASLESKRILITQDLDFADIPTFPPSSHRGVIVIKCRPFDLKGVQIVLKKLLKEIPPKDLAQALFIVDKSKYRVRR